MSNLVRGFDSWPALTMCVFVMLGFSGCVARVDSGVGHVQWAAREAVMKDATGLLDSDGLVINPGAGTGRPVELYATAWIFEMASDLGVTLPVVDVAQALVNDLAVVVADEPTSGLDDENAGHLVGLLSDLARFGTSVVIATHDARVVPYATRTLALGGGGVL